MHYYNFNIGDFIKDSAHLTLEEDAIYRRLIDLYYTTEKAIQLDIKLVARSIRARDKEDAIALILEEFFVKTEKGFKQKRIDAELKKYKEKSIKASNSAKARWSKGSGECERNANASTTHSEGNANQEPITNNQEPITILKNSDNPSDHSPVPYVKIVELYHSVLPSLPEVQTLTNKRKGQISQRWKSKQLPDLETWKEYFEHVGESKFLMGLSQSSGSRKVFKANLEWLTNESNFVKVWENNYHE